MKGTLYIQRHKGKQLDKPSPLECELDMGINGIILAGAASSVIACMHKAHVDLIGADGLLISGVEEYSNLQLHYQEWWFVPIISNE